MKALFKEKQKFKKLFLTVLLFALCILPIIYLIAGYESRTSIDDYILGGIGFILLSILIFAIMIAFALSKLTIFINQYGIFINFFPFVKKHIGWFSVKEARFVDCVNIKGIGMSLNTKFGTAFKIKGDTGLYLKLKNNKEYLIATKRPEKLEKVVETYRNVHNFK